MRKWWFLRRNPSQNKASMDAATPREENKMDIRCTSTGKTFYQIDSQVASLLVEALPTVFEKVEKAAPEKQPGSARFALDRSLTRGEPHISFSCDACGQGGALLNSHPSGTPGRSAAQYAEDSARAFAFWHCGKKEVLSETLIKDFRKTFE